MDVQKLLERMEAQRKHWVELEPGKRLQYLRPPETELPKFVTGLRLEHVIGYACGWDGFTEADLLTGGVGGSDAVPFHADLWAAVVKDRATYVPIVAKAMAATVDAFIEQREATAKNSLPSSP